MMTRPRGFPRLEIPRLWIGVWLAAAYLAVVALFLASGLDMEGWDDSYFFKRIGLNILEHGAAAWNVEDGPVYGNTSQGFQLLSLIPLLIDPDHYISLVKILLAAAMVALLALLPRAARPPAPEAPAPSTSTAQDRVLAWGLAFLAASAPYLLLLIHSGMETCAALVVLAANLLAVHRNRGTRRDIAAVVATTVLVYLIRPDAVLISLLSITAHGWLRDRRLPWRTLVCCGLALLAVLGAFYLYFGTPFPLAFYLKSRALTVYTDQFVDMDLHLKRRNVAGLLVMAAPFLYVAAHGRSAWTWTMVLSFVAFSAYHYFSTVEVMGYYARFYVPALVPVALAAIDAAPRFRARSRLLVSLAFSGLLLAAVLYLYRHRLVYDEKDQLITRVDDVLYLGYVAAAAILLAGARVHAQLAAILVAIPIVAGAARGLPMPEIRLRADEALLAKHIDRFTTVRGIHAVRACVPEPFHMYHTEIGVPGVVFQRSTVTDMAGLMDTEIARHGMDFEARCLADRPEVLYLPHRNYETLRDQIARSTCIREYRRVVGNSSSPLYIRKDLARDFLTCAREVGDRWIDAR